MSDYYRRSPKVIPIPRVNEREFNAEIDRLNRRARRVDTTKKIAAGIGIAVLGAVLLAAFASSLYTKTHCRDVGVVDAQGTHVTLKVCADGRTTIESEDP